MISLRDGMKSKRRWRYLRQLRRFEEAEPVDFAGAQNTLPGLQFGLRLVDLPFPVSAVSSWRE